MKVKDNKDHFIHFVEKWFIIGIILFIVVQIFAGIIIKSTFPDEQKESYERYQDNYLGHCQAFFY